MVDWIPQERLRIVVDDRPVQLPRWLAAAVDEYWHKVQAAHPYFFRGPVLTTTGVFRRAEQTVIRCGFTDFAHYLFSEQLRSGDRHQVHPVFAAACPVTRDGMLVFAQMAAETARPHRVQAIGGTPLPQEIRGSDFLPKAAALRELAEETGIAESELTRPPAVVGATLDGDGSVAVVVRCDLALNEADVRSLAHSFWQQEFGRGHPPELEDLVALPWGAAGLSRLEENHRNAVRYVKKMLLAPELMP